MDKPKFVVQRITDGLEFGDGAISGQEGDPEVLAVVDKTIHTHPDIIVPVDKDDDGSILEDDGCGDGREAGLVMGFGKILKRSLNRAKVFGGAAAMAAAARIGLGKGANRSLNEVFDDSIDQLEAKGIDFGAHTADHVKPGREGLDCGCGAIDGAPETVRAVVKYENAIRAVIKSLGVDTEGLDEVMRNYRDYAEQLSAQEPYSGQRVMQRIIKMGKVVKQLMGGHKERRIVLNAVRDYTINQKLIRDVTVGKAQIFGVDTWRLGDIATNLYPEDKELQHRALLSGLVYTLGVAAVLTPGDLPVDMITEAA